MGIPVFLFARSILGTLHSYHTVSVKLSRDGSFSREANRLAFEAARPLTVTCLYDVRVALYTDNRIKIQVLPFYLLQYLHSEKTITELNNYSSKRPLAPQGSTSPFEETGKPISSAFTVP